ncbi:Dyp-type peroxidase [Dietzia sp. PP-33]|nr:Dyp-type peroxidase domain-containing protein [Dietzia sp. PP-33]MDX2356041.1 Dyp-type peroxidase [Dietzia sp. PP-33]
MAFGLREGVRRTDLIGVLRAWTQDAARLTQGRGGLADLQHELAEGPSRLTVTIGFGPELLGKVGLSDRTPEWLQQLPDFPQIDRLEDRWSGGDLLLQICADDPLTVAHSARILSSGVRRRGHSAVGAARVPSCRGHRPVRADTTQPLRAD